MKQYLTHKHISCTISIRDSPYNKMENPACAKCKEI